MATSPGRPELSLPRREVVREVSTHFAQCQGTPFQEGAAMFGAGETIAAYVVVASTIALCGLVIVTIVTVVNRLDRLAEKDLELDDR